LRTFGKPIVKPGTRVCLCHDFLSRKFSGFNVVWRCRVFCNNQYSFQLQIIVQFLSNHVDMELTLLQF
jgi:hypothetical protein